MDETFIVVSHDIDFVRNICDRVAVMKGGKVVGIGETKEMLAGMAPEPAEVHAD
jgi:methyl coenzyme M reductase system subunit A2